MKLFNLLPEKTQGAVLLFITCFASFGLLVLISEFTNIINFII
jgi:hypothetical protein